MNPNNILFLDIETVAAKASFHELDERMQELWTHKSVQLRSDKSPEESFERAGIYAEFGKIIAIAVGYFKTDEEGKNTLRVKAFSGHDEKELLQDFCSLLLKFENPRMQLCAHNGKEFDFPYICRRLLINGFALPEILNLRGKKPWEIHHIDTLELWKFGDYKHFTSLDLLASIFNIPTSKSDINGSQVNAVYYKTGDIERITEYCKRDVIVLAKLFMALHQLPIPEEEKIKVL